jgi:signal transduction histidine kinase
MAEVRAWTIKGRIQRWILLLVVAQVLLLQIPAILIVRAVLNSELSNLLEEEQAEFQSALTFIRASGRDVVASDLDEFVNAFSERHPRFPLALELWSGETLIGRAGPSYLIDAATADPTMLDQRVDAGGWIAWRAESAPHGELATVVVDGRAQREELVGFGVLMLVLLFVWGSTGLAFGLFLARRISGMMSLLGSRARSMLTGGEETLVGEALPEEVGPFVRELSSGIESMSAESARFRLMAAGLAHELSAPIQNLASEMEVALMKDRDPASYKRVIESNLDEMRDLGEAVHNLLLLCSERKAEQVVEEFDLSFELGLRLSGEKRQALRKSVELAIDFEGDLRIAADREAILRALRNLVANAIAWTPEGGRVGVEVVGTDGRLVATVEDEGPGVPAELRDKVFEPFFRGPSGAGRRAGYGLGLAMVKASAEAAGGSVELSDSPSGGARFRFAIPRQSLPENKGQPLQD